MKTLLRMVILFGVCVLVIACRQSTDLTASPVPVSTATSTLMPSPTATNISTPTITSTVQPENLPPTLIPTIDPTLIAELLKKSFSVEMLEGLNGHPLRKISGWKYGFGGGFLEGSCPAYSWLDASHLLLYPAAGQTRAFDQWQGTGFVPQPVVINIESGAFWLPPANESASPLTCNRVYRSRELSILITSEIDDGVSNVSTYTYDGRKLKSFPGGIWAISPSGTKILIEESKLLDLKTNKTIDLNWSREDYHEEMISGLFWTYPDEARIYRCCYFYADLNTGTSYRFDKTDFLDRNGNPLNYEGLWLYRGGWVRNNTYFLVNWSYIDDGDMRYLPMFDPATKVIYDVRAMAGISEDLTCYQTSSNGLYVWMGCYDKNYLVNLATFETELYTGLFNSEIDWSADNEYALLEGSDSSNTNQQYYLLSLSNKKLQTLAINDLSDFWYGWWHPTDPVFAYISEQDQSLVLFNAETATFQKLKSPVTFQSFAWNSDGDRIALAAEDGSVWQVDYPKLDHLEQLTPPLPHVHSMDWSPDGNSIAFISAADIYIIETAK